MRRGAFDFITKPFQPEVVRATVRRACERTRLLRENEVSLKRRVQAVDRMAAVLILQSFMQSREH